MHQNFSHSVATNDLAQALAMVRDWILFARRQQEVERVIGA